MEDDKPNAIPALGHFPKAPVTTGTTLVAIQYKDGVVFGTDSRTTMGTYISSRATDKITPITDRIICGRAGTAGDTQAVADIVKFYVETYGIMEKKPLSIYRVAQLFRNLLYEYREQLSGSVMIAGYDEKEGAQIYESPLGGFVLRRAFSAMGSGAHYATSYLDSQWRPDLALDETIQMVKMAIYLATMRDASSGGVIRLAVVDKNGIKREICLPEKFPVLYTPCAFSMFPKHSNSGGGLSGMGEGGGYSRTAQQSQLYSEESDELSLPIKQSPVGVRQA